MSRMHGSRGTAVIVQLERLFRRGTLTGSSEVELLHRFVTGRDEAAFEAIVARHGPMVLGVCRELLRDPNDVDDAFQATFLVLVRKAGSLKRCDLLGNWLYGVAHRVAIRARAMTARRTARAAAAIEAARSGTHLPSAFETSMSYANLLEPEPEPWLHQEIARLPEKYRVPIVLCYMEGLTHEDAARRLEWPLGTVKGRLARARDLLRKRLARRGITLSTATLVTNLSSSDARATVPAALIQATLRAAETVMSHAGVSLAVSSTVSLPVAALGEGVLHAMTLTQLKTIALPVLLLGAVTTGVVAFAAQGNPKERKGGSQAASLGSSSVQQASPTPNPRPSPQPAPQPGPKSTAELLRDQLLADQELFDDLVISSRALQQESARAFVRWSLRLLEANRSISSGHRERVAAYTAHRDRIKSLNALATRSSLPDRTKAMVAAQLKVAEELLGSEASAQEPMTQRPSPATEPPTAVAQGPPAGSSRAAGTVSVPIDLPSRSSQPQNPFEQPAGMTSSQPQNPFEQPAGMMGMMMTGRNAMMGGGAGMAGAGGAMGGGGMTGRAGMIASTSPEAFNRRQRIHMAGSAAEMAVRSTNPRSQVIHKKLEEPISMSFANPTPLDDYLKYIKQATTSPTFAGVPIYLDPKGLDETNCTLNSTITIDLEYIPLRTTLRLALKQLGLAYCVRDGVLIISSVQGINEELAEEQSELDALNEQKDGPAQKIQ